VTPFRLAHNRRRARLRVAGLVLALAAVAGAVAAFPHVTGRADPPAAQRGRAVAALAAAREVSSAFWAPAPLAEAESWMKAATLEDRRQELRFVVWRNYGTARALYEEVVVRAQASAAEARARLGAARDLAEAARDRAQEALAEAESLLEGIRLPHAPRSALRAARARLAEASLLLEEGAYASAQSRSAESERHVSRALDGAGALAARFGDERQVARWRGWVDETVAWSRKKRSAAIVVVKDERVVRLYHNGRNVRTYQADLGPNSAANKVRAGDKTTPEGRYRITAKKGAGRSRYHKALLLNYPNEEDLRRFRQLKKQGLLEPGAHPGGLIEIHGDGGRGGDWTLGCVALSNRDMDDLFDRVQEGTPVTIVGGLGASGRLTELARRLARSNGHAAP
jgi:hypothetical protein